MADPVWTNAIEMRAGMFPDMAPREAEGFYRIGSWVRFDVVDDSKQGALTVRKGWEKASNDTFMGKIRKIIQYTTIAGYAWAMLWGHSSAWAFTDGELYFTTPVASYGVLTNAFSTALGDATVTVAHTAHGRTTGDFINFPESPVVTGSGITLTSGYYPITRIDADSYTIEGPNVATAAVSGVGGAVDYEYFLATGNEYSLGGAGYGTGLYNAGLYGRTTSGTFAARTATLDIRDQNVIAGVRNGGVYEMAPYTSAADLAELVTNGTFTGSASGWTLGANWAYGANDLAATLSSASATQDITIKAGAWHLIKFNMTRSAGTLQVSLNGTNVGSAQSATNRVFIRVWGGNGGTQTLSFTGTGFTGTIDNVSTKTLGTFAPVTNAPTQINGALMTQYDHCMVWGCIPNGKSEFDPMCVKQSNAGDIQDWTLAGVAAGSEAREFFLTGGSEIKVIVKGATQLYALTDRSMSVGTYSPVPTVVWRWDQIAGNHGCIGINAAGMADGRLFWMGNNRTFWVYDGTRPKPLRCPGTKWVFDNLQFVQQDTIQFFHDAGATRVEWWWADRRDNTNEISRYASYDYITGIWEFGERVRTAWGEAGALGYPLATGTNGYLYFHEKGHTAADGALDAYARTGAFDLGDGNTLIEVSGYIPDLTDAAGSHTIRFYGYAENENSTPEDSGALAVAPMTTMLQNFFVQGRQIVWEHRWNDAPARARIGNPRFLIQDTGNQF